VINEKESRVEPIISSNLEDLDTPGVMVEVDPEEADLLGAFEETALSEEDAWLSNIEGEDVES
jgi:hypothetical protein